MIAFLALNLHTNASAAGKKGVGAWPSYAHEAAAIIGMNNSWYYDWGTKGIGDTPGVPFIPMIWGSKNVNDAELAAAKATGAGILLGFNEPDAGGQSNMTVEQALDDWPKLMATGMRLGSPAPGTGDDVKPNGWLARFMAGAKSRGYRVDFICLHPYQSDFDVKTALANLRKELQYVHDKYGLPIWVTEYGMANWGDNTQPDDDTAAKFATASAEMMAKMPFIERYAWYAAIPNQKSFSLTNADGTLTKVGEAWRHAP